MSNFEQQSGGQQVAKDSFTDIVKLYSKSGWFIFVNVEW